MMYDTQRISSSTHTSSSYHSSYHGSTGSSSDYSSGGASSSHELSSGHDAPMFPDAVRDNYIQPSRDAVTTNSSTRPQQQLPMYTPNHSIKGVEAPTQLQKTGEDSFMMDLLPQTHFSKPHVEPLSSSYPSASHEKRQSSFQPRSPVSHSTFHRHVDRYDPVAAGKVGTIIPPPTTSATPQNIPPLHHGTMAPPPPPFPPPPQRNTREHNQFHHNNAPTNNKIEPLPLLHSHNRNQETSFPKSIEFPVVSTSFDSGNENNYFTTMLSNDDASELSSYASPSHIFPHAVPSNNYQSAPPKKQNKIPMHPTARARSEHNVFAQSSLPKNNTFSSHDVLQEYNSHGGVELKLDQQCQNDHIDYHRHESKRKSSQKSNTEGVASSQRTKALQQIMAEMEELYELRARAVQEKQSTVFWEKQIRELQQSIFSICEETAYAAACSPAAMVIDPQDENCIENTINSQEIAAVATAIRASRENSCNSMGLATVSNCSSKSFDSYEQRREERSVQSEDERIHAHDQRNDSYEILHAMTDNSFNTLTTKNKDRQSVKVRAPADLPGGHTFVAKTKGRSIIAVVVSIYYHFHLFCLL